MSIINKIFISLIIILSLISNVSADFTWTDAGGINAGLDENYNYIIWNSTTVSTTEGIGTIIEANLDASGITTSESRVNGKGVLFAAHDPTIITGGKYRVWFVDLSHDIAYTDSLNVANLSLGYFSNPSGLGCSLGGNCNPVHKQFTHTGGGEDTATKNIAIDQNGDVYFVDSNILKVLRKSDEYAAVSLRTFANGVDWTTAPTSYNVQVDTNYVYVGISDVSYVNRNVYTKTGTAVKFERHTGSGVAFRNVTQTIDATTPLTNYTVGWYDGINTAYIIFNRSGMGNSTTSGTVGIRYQHLGGRGNLLFWASKTSDLVTTISTNMTVGFVSSQVSLVPRNTYNTASVSSLYDTYYNNSDVFINYIVNVETNSVRELDSVISRAIYGTSVKNHYKWKIVLVDPNGIPVQNTFTDTCQLNILNTECSLSGTLKYPPPVNNWANGSWTVDLYEYFMDTGDLALLTSDTYTIDFNLSSPIPEPEVPIDSGTGSTTLTQIDGWVALLGMGVNQVSKFSFALLITLAITFFGFAATKGNLYGGVITGALPYCFFVFIGYFPVWTVIIIVMAIGNHLGWFR